MKKRLGAILLIGIVVITIGGLYWADRYRAYRETEARRFHARDTAAIVRIDLIEKHGDTLYRQLFLTRRQNAWWVNDTLEAFLDPVQRFLKVLAGQTPRAAVVPTALTNTLRFLKEHRIEVTIRYADGTKDAFYVGGPTPDQRAAYMLKVGADQPYEVFLPGLEGYLTPYYIPDLTAWQDNFVFQVSVADLHRLSLAYSDSPLQSWTLERPQPQHSWTLATGEPIDSLKLMDYLLAYQGRFTADELIPADSLLGLLPLYELKIETFSQVRYHIAIYPHRSSPMHYYLRLFHRPYFTYSIGRYRMDAYFVPRSHFTKAPA